MQLIILFTLIRITNYGSLHLHLIGCIFKGGVVKIREYVTALQKSTWVGLYS